LSEEYMKGILKKYEESGHGCGAKLKMSPLLPN
jgi:hypothetical protein